MSEHRWVDDALQPDGHAWQHGIRYRCLAGCGIEQRAMFNEGYHVQRGQATDRKTWLYFRGVRRLPKDPGCT